MQRVRDEVHRGQPLIVVDYSGMRDKQEVLDLIWSSAREIQSRPPGSQRVLMRVHDVHFDGRVVSALKEAGVQNKPYLKAVAVVGITGLTKIIHRAMMTLMRIEMPAFDTDEEAREWLAAQA